MSNPIESRPIDIAAVKRVDAPTSSAPDNGRSSTYFLGSTPLLHVGIYKDGIYSVNWDTTIKNLNTVAPFDIALRGISESWLPRSSSNLLGVSWVTAEGDLRGSSPLSEPKDVMPLESASASASLRRVIDLLDTDWPNLVSADISITPTADPRESDPKERVVLWLDGPKTDLPQQIGFEAPLNFSPTKSLAALIRQTNPAFENTDQDEIEKLMARVNADNLSVTP